MTDDRGIDRKYTLIEVKEIIEQEGLGYAIKDYMGSEHIADPTLAALWQTASDAMTAICKLLHLEE